MHFFAVFVLLSLGVTSLTVLGERGYRRWREARSLLAAGLGVALAWLANFDMWTGWAIPGLRYAWVGVTLTGLAIGGTALLGDAIYGFFAGMDRKLEDEADELEKSDLRRVA